MSALPERRRTPEEIAGLRAALGVPGAPPPGSPPTGQPAATTPPAATPPAATPPAATPPAPSAAPRPGRPVRSLKRSERAPGPVAVPPPRPGGALPARRHSDGELQRLRPHNAMAGRPPVQQLAAQAAHPMLVGTGYLLALGGGAGGLLVAGWLFARKPRSRHHAALMTIIAVLVLAFGILYFLAKRDAA